MKSEVIKGMKWTTLGTVVLAVVALLKVSILARYLDKTDFGLMALVTLVMGFMNLFNDMGLTSAILHKQEISKKEYASLYWFNMMVSLAMYLMLWLITPLIASFYNEPQLNQLIPLLGLNLILSGVGRMFKTIENKHLLFKQVTVVDIVAASISLILAVILAVNGYGVYALVYSALAQYVISNFLLLFLGLKKYGLLWYCRFNHTRPFLKIGMYQVGGQTINYFNRDLDILIIGKFFSAEVLGGYSLAKQLVMRPMQILNPILTKVGAPTLAKFQNSMEALRANYLKLINAVSTINFLIYALLLALAPLAIQILYGSGFEEIVSLVRILCLYMFIRAVSSPVGSLVTATGKTNLEFYWNLLTLLVTPVFIYAGSYYGVNGAAWGITLSMAVLFIPAWRLLVHRMTGAGLKEYLKAVAIPYLPVGSIRKQ